MSDVRNWLDRWLGDFDPKDDLEGALRRAHRRERSRRIVAGSLALVLATGGVAVAARQFWSRPASEVRDPGGVLVFASNMDYPPDGPTDLYSINPDGTGLTRLTNTEAAELGPAVSADGRLIAFMRDGTQDATNLYVIKADGSDERRVATPLRLSSPPAWSPDGRWIAVGEREEPPASCPRTSDGQPHDCGLAPGLSLIPYPPSHLAVKPLPGCPWGPCGGGDAQPSWSPDGSQIAFVRAALAEPDGQPGTVWGGELDVVSVGDPHTVGDETVRALTTRPGWFGPPAWSPDGRWIAAGSDGNVVLIDPATGAVHTILESPPGENYLGASWSPDGTRLAFLGESREELRVYTARSDGSDRRLVYSLPAGQGAELMDLTWGAASLEAPLPGPSASSRATLTVEPTSGPIGTEVVLRGSCALVNASDISLFGGVDRDGGQGRFTIEADLTHIDVRMRIPSTIPRYAPANAGPIKVRPGDRIAFGTSPPTACNAPPGATFLVTDGDAPTFQPNSVGFFDDNRGIATGEFEGRGACDPDCRGAIQVTDDGGASWSTVFEDQYIPGKLSLVGDEAWAPADCLTCDPHLLLHSADRGATWERWAKLSASEALIASPTLGWGILGHDPGAVFDVSGDAGRTWRLHHVPCPSTYWVAQISIPNPAAGWLYCEGQGGTGAASKALYRSSDGGTTWALMSKLSNYDSSQSPVGAIPKEGFVRTLDMRDDGFGVMGLYLHDLEPDIESTDDGGRTWHQISFGSPFQGVSLSGVAFQGHSTYALVARCRSNGSCQRGLLRSEDDGRTWQQVYLWPYDSGTA